MKTYNVLSDSTSHTHTHTHVSTHSGLTNTFAILTHTCRRGGNWCTGKLCERQFGFQKLSFYNIRHITWWAYACKNVSICSLCLSTTVCVRQPYFADWERGRSEKEWRGKRYKERRVNGDGRRVLGWGIQPTETLKAKISWSDGPKIGWRTVIALCFQGQRTRLCKSNQQKLEIERWIGGERDDDRREVRKKKIRSLQKEVTWIGKW